MTNPKRDESRDYGIWHEKHVLIPWAAVPEGSTVFERYVPISALKEPEPMPLVSKVSTYEFDLDSVKELFASELNAASSSLSVEYVIQEDGGDPMGRFPGVKKVTKVRVTVRS